MFRTAALLVAASALAGCAVPLRLPLAPEHRASIQELDAKVVLIQDEIIVDVKAPNASAAGAMGGLIGAIITTTIDSAVTNSRVKSAQDAMVPFYAAIEDLDLRKDFDEALRPALASYPIKVSSVTTTAVSFNNARLRKWRESLKPGQALLLVVPHYRMSSDFRTIDIETWVTIWKKDGDENRPDRRAILRYQSVPRGPGGVDSVALWSADRAAAFRTAMKEAIAETVVLAHVDMGLNDKADSTGTERDFGWQSDGAAATVRGRLVSETAARVVVLGADGRLYSLPKAAPAAAAAAAPKG